MEHKKEGIRVNLNSMVYVALMAAVIYAIAQIRVPAPMGVVHLGDSMVLMAAILLGKKKGAVAAAIGMTLFDILGGYLVWAPFTMVIKFSMAYVAGAIAFRKDYNGENIKNNLLAFIVASIVMIFGYYLSGIIVAKMLLSSAATWYAANIMALNEVIFNVGQGVAAIVIALPLSKVIKPALRKANIDL
ncbi:ECF transporter S component [Clostridium sp. DL1XJH146]